MTTPARDPGSVTQLQRRLSTAASSRASTVRRLQSLVASIALCQLLPPSAVKGGTGLKLRLGERLTRQTPDLDTAFRGDQAAFLEQLRSNLETGWGHFTGTVTEGTPRPPLGVPPAYVMQPLTVKLRYHHRDFATVDIEVGYDELEATTSEPPELALSEEIIGLFAELGLAPPEPVRVLPLHHQISQKIHACTEPGNQRAHDLVDLQLLAPLTNAALVAHTTRRLFTFRQQHLWPPAVVVGPNWDTLYADAAVGLDVLSDVNAAARWLNEYVVHLGGL